MNKLLNLQYNSKKNTNQSKIELQQYAFLIIFAIIIEIIFFAGETSNNIILSFIATAMLLCCGFFMCTEKNMYLLLFLLPNQRFVVIPGSSTTLLNIIVFIMFFKLTFSNEKLYISNIVSMILLIVYSCNIFIRLNSINEMLMIVKMCITIITLLWIFSRYSLNKAFYFNCVKFLGIGCVVASLIALVGSDEFVIGTSLRFSGGENNNSNIFGSMLSYSVSSVILAVTAEKRKSKLLTALILILLIFGLLTQSRSFLLAIVFGMVYITIFGTTLNTKTRKVILCILLVLVFIIVVSIMNPNTLIGKILNPAMNRILNPKNGDISNGRVELWSLYIQFLTDNKEYLFLGIGNHLNSFGFDNVAHNGVIEVITSYGFIGFVLILILLLINWNNLKKAYMNNVSCNYVKVKKLYYLPLLTQLVTNITGHNFFNIAFIIQLFISCAGVYSLTLYNLHGVTGDLD